MAFGDNHQTLGVDAQAHWAVRKAGGHAIATAVERDQARWRYPLSLFDKPVEHCGQRHQGRFLGLPDIGNAAWQCSMCSLSPKKLAAFFQPTIQRIKIGKGWHELPEPVTRITHILLDLSTRHCHSDQWRSNGSFPTRRWIAKLGIKDIVAGHRQEPRIHIALLASPDPVDGGLHSIV